MKMIFNLILLASFLAGMFNDAQSQEVTQGMLACEELGNVSAVRSTDETIENMMNEIRDFENDGQICYVMIKSLQKSYKPYLRDGYPKFDLIPPNTPEELLNYCNRFKTEARVYLGVMCFDHKCGFRVIDVFPRVKGHKMLFEQLRKYLNFLDSICSYDSEVFQVISKRITCIRFTMQFVSRENNVYEFGDYCKWSHLSGTDKKEFLEALGNDERCAKVIWMLDCVSAHFEFRCGKRLGHVVREILRNSLWVAPNCTDRYLKLPYLLKGFLYGYREDHHGESSKVAAKVLEVIKEEEFMKNADEMFLNTVRLLMDLDRKIYQEWSREVANSET